MRQIFLGIGILVGLAACTPAAEGPQPHVWTTLDGQPPLVIAHRGASGDRPEHTLEAFRLAISQGADVIEPDLVMTADGVLVVRHDHYLSTTTNIADLPEYADRRRTQGDREDWWVEDFTLAEIRALRARQPWPQRDASYNDQFLIPTFEEVLDLAAEHNVRTEPEVKAPGHFTAIGLDPLPVLVEILRARGLDTADAPTAIQCFEPDFLARLNGEVETRLLMLVFPMIELDTEADPLTPTVSLEDAATFADGVGPSKALLISADGDDTGFVTRAHALGLAVHPWTFRDDVPVSEDMDIDAELQRIYALGVDGVFTDFPATAVQVRDAMSDG
ncbi:glycerophosphodiester phosphodiesterase family protein [Maricaulis sp.]|uniref:glycerophosphodiester phosphodiesterase family protein n=1 Tax=Maricaulis sp. TaxID=1486257 RepID=UPI0026001F25|nr:glycerophosphodiester phosphodiesterase family protein [Maricaulis sp.]MDF1767787.1 glycerophosphodiester phosphodiesterase family protein [Maricaulis sp.]